jgi:mannose/fructose/N-acetylgalactosamine-specific phosphotransferase system component IIC
MDQHYQEWSENAPRGLLLIGAGISVIGQAIVLKAQRKPALHWFLFGFVGLIVFNAGVSIFGEAVKHRALYESKLE